MIMSTKTSEAQADLRRLREDLSQVRSDLGDLAESLLSLGRGKLTSARHGVSEAADAGVERLHDVLARIRERGRNAGKSVRQQVESHPAASVLAALGLGLLVGKLLHRG